MYRKYKIQVLISFALMVFHNKRQIKQVYERFRAFIRQADTFYNSAQTLHYRASALFLYYSFLNLSKAYLVLRTSNIINTRVQHGLFHRQRLGAFEKQTIRVSGGVFPNLYRELMDTNIKHNISLNITQLFGYIPDIGHEFNLVKYGPSKITFGMLRACSDYKRKKSWPLIALSDTNIIDQYPKFYSRFNNHLERVQISPYEAKELFDMDAATIDKHRFYQSKKEYSWGSQDTIPIGQIRNNLLKSLDPNIETIHFPSDYEYLLFGPLRPNLQIPFNDTIAVYVIMYYLGSLVRYFPSYLENLYDSKHAWIIERFVTCAGIIFLRNMANNILRHHYIYSSTV